MRNGLADQRNFQDTGESIYRILRALGQEGQCQRTASIEIGRIGGIQSAFFADTRKIVRCEAGRVLETALLVLVSRKGDPFFQPQVFSWSHEAWSAWNDCSWLRLCEKSFVISDLKF